MDYTFTTISSFDGTGSKVAAIEVFNPVTGATISICRRRPFESKAAWVARAFADTAKGA